MKNSYTTQKKSLDVKKRLSLDQMENIVAGDKGRQCFMMGMLTLAAAAFGGAAFLGAAMYTTQNCG